MPRSIKSHTKLRIFLVVKEIIMVMLVVISFIFLLLEYFEKLSNAQLLMIDVYEVFVAFVFITEFIFEWYHSRDRKKYVRHHWFYLFAAIPIPTQSFEILRGIRLLRLVKFIKIFAHLRYENNTRLFSS